MEGKALVRKYKKKKNIVEAIQVFWDTIEEIREFVPKKYFKDFVYMESPAIYSYVEKEGIDRTKKMGVFLLCNEGLIVAKENDWIIKDSRDLIHVLDNVTFLDTYQLVES